MSDVTGDQGERHEASTSVDVDATPERVWRTLTEPDLVRRYMHGTDLDADWREGGRVFWRGEWEGKPYEDKGEVLAVRPPRLLSVTHWSPLTGEPDAPEYYHHVTYELTPLGDDRTRLTLTHGNSPSREAAEAMIENGWRPMLQSLKQVAETEG
jgi:uncharacterized protein YndB with AHSA1/START domain